MTISTAIVLCALGIASDWSASAMADDTSSAVVPVSYTTGQQGHKLKWLPYRPTLPKTDTPAVAPRQVAQRISAEPSPTPVAPARPADDSTFDNPFGDGKTGPVFASPEQAISDAPLTRSEPDPSQFALDLLQLEPRQPTSQEIQKEYDDQDRELARTRVEISGDCEDAKKGLKPIKELDTDIAASDGEFPPECTLSEENFDPHEMRGWGSTTYTWKASGLCHKPLYFEDVHLERYGHSWGPYLQPLLSGGHFFLTVPVLPYKMGLYPPGECMYTLGYYRPGSCAPYLLDPLPLSVRAALVQAGVFSGLAAAIP